MFLVEAVGERFLWIDSLCIVQDNESELKKTLESMHSVYRQAVSADGITADASLAGVQLDSRDIGPVTGILDGIPLIQNKKKAGAGDHAMGEPRLDVSRGYILSEVAHIFQ